MAVTLLPRHPGLSATTRLQSLASDEASATLHDWMILLAAGVLAACASTFLDLNIRRVPGQAILRVVFPMAVGLAMVPRRGAGCAMATTALLTGIFFRYAGLKGEAMGLGALTSLAATGPLLDWTLSRAKGGWRQYLLFALAGMSSNLVALAVRGGAKYMGWEHAGRRPLWEWLSQASYTYIACGLLAGLASGAILFYASDKTPSTPVEPTP